MGGTVKVESEGLGHGTQFIIQLTAHSKVKSNELHIQYEQNIQDSKKKDKLEAALKAMGQS